MMQKRVIELLKSTSIMSNILVKGWIRTRRDSKDFSFLEINDGSSLKNIQVLLDKNTQGYNDLQKMNTGASVSIEGDLIESPGSGQKFEVKSKKVEVLGEADAEAYPLQKKRHTLEFLRTIAHLRPRSNMFGAAFRVRSHLSFAIHKFFYDKGFVYVHTPIITASDCEGAGQMFQVTTLNLENPPRKDGKIDYNEDFFGKKTFLTVSGQLEGETFATSLGLIYTFGPTFRAENSNTTRHMSEFWMIEPEMAFYDINDNMNLAEEFVKYLIDYALKNCADDLELFNNFVDKDLLKNLDLISRSPFERLTYTDAIKILEKENSKFEFKVKFGTDLQSEHERFLSETVYKKPVILYNYPKAIKSFYMRQNDDDLTVAAMDVIAPKFGEIIGGSQREERMDKLINRINELKLDEKNYSWYLDTRRFGTVPHSGFGLGFERAIMLITGIQNIRDVIPFPRTPKSAEF